MRRPLTEGPGRFDAPAASEKGEIQMRPSSRPAVLGLWLGACFAASSCGSSGSTGSTSGGACQSACARCGGDPCVDCTGASDRYRDEYERALYSCVNGADGCSAATWSTCSAQASISAPRRAADDTYRDACMAKRSACASQGVNFADDACLSSTLLSDAWLQMANDCIAKSCADVSACMGEIFK